MNNRTAGRWLPNYILILLIGTLQFLYYGCEGNVSYKPPILLPVKLVLDSSGKFSIAGNTSLVTPMGTFSIGAKYSISQKPKGITVILRNHQTEFDDVYRVRARDELLVVLNGKTIVEVSKDQVLIDVTKGKVESIEFKRCAAPLKESDSSFWDEALFGYRPFALFKWAYNDTMIEKWPFFGYVAYLFNLLGSLLLGAIDIVVIVIFGVGQIAGFLFGQTGRNITIGILTLITPIFPFVVFAVID